MRNNNYQKFLILSAPRTGSNYLTYLLASHPEVISMSEMYDKDEIWTWPWKTPLKKIPFIKLYRDLLPVSFLKRVIFSQHPLEIKAVGFKFMYHQAESEKLSNMTKYLISLKNLKVIHLKRTNLLDNLISLRLAEETGDWISYTESNKSLKIYLEYEECLNHFEKTSALDKKYGRLFAGNNKLDVYYEDLISSAQKELNKILHFLAISRRVLQCDTKKQNNRLAEEVIINYKQLREKFNKSEWKIFFK